MIIINDYRGGIYMNTLVSPENTWVLLAIMCSAAGISIYLEQHYAWASKLSGAIIALVFALVLVNLQIIPTSLPCSTMLSGDLPFPLPFLCFCCKLICVKSGKRRDGCSLSSLSVPSAR